MSPALIVLLLLSARAAVAAPDAGAVPNVGAGGVAGAPAPLELSLPFTGVWGVLQGFDSGETHTGYAAFALDFVPPQVKARVQPRRLADFACYGRPILAAADGVVVRVAKGFRDRPPNARVQPAHGGNFVIIQHAPSVYTEMVHLKAGSVRVAVGDTVRRGEVIGRCGNSGNATTPHLHLGLLTAIDPIATGRMKLARYEVLGTDGRWTPGDGEPKHGQWIRPVDAALR